MRLGRSLWEVQVPGGGPSGFGFACNEFANLNRIPGLIMIGSVAVPLSLLIFFFEVNVPRNISLSQVIKLVLTGGLVSIIVSLFFFEWTAGLTSWIGAASAGIIEETGKAPTLLLAVHGETAARTAAACMILPRRGGPHGDVQHTPSVPESMIQPRGMTTGRFLQPRPSGRRIHTPMLMTIAVVLLVLWALGLVTSSAIGGFIHILLVLAIIVVLVRVIQGRKPV